MVKRLGICGDGSSQGGKTLSSWLKIKSWASIQRVCRSVHEGGLGDACIKARGDGAGTKAGLGVKELRADKRVGGTAQREKIVSHPPPKPNSPP